MQIIPDLNWFLSSLGLDHTFHVTGGGDTSSLHAVIELIWTTPTQDWGTPLIQFRNFSTRGKYQVVKVSKVAQVWSGAKDANAGCKDRVKKYGHYGAWMV